MFQRKKPLTILQKAKEAVWPSMGWKRMFRYTQLRLMRITDTTRAIAIGLAFGMAISFVPPGVHIISAVALAAIFGGNMLAAVVGTVFGNPWTFPIMWWMSYKVGDFFFRIFGWHIVQVPSNFTLHGFMGAMADQSIELIMPWALGGLILMVLFWPVFYILSYRMVKKLRHKHGRHTK